MEQIRKLGPYTLVSKIGMGGFGVVWLAEKRTAIATTQVALKLPRGEDIDLDAFKQEAEIWIQASGHPNVLPLIDADIYDGQVVIVSEYVPDGSLAGWLRDHGGKASSAAAACEIMDGVLAGLAHLHARRIIHRDLKPENILLQRETPRLADFGIARLLKTGSYSSNVSGTFAYMAPEAFDGKRNEQTDVWSAGVIFYQMLAARLPYDQPDTVSLVGAIMLNDPPPLPESVPAVVRSIAAKALQRDPINRYATVAEMRGDLREAEHQLWLGGRVETVKVPPSTLTLPEPTPTKEMPPVSTLPPTIAPLIAHRGPAQGPEKTRKETFGAVGSPTVDTPNPQRESSAADNLIGKSNGLVWLTGAGAAAVVVLLTVVAFSVVIYFWVSRHRIEKTSAGTYALRQTLINHNSSVDSVAFSPDGKLLASGSDDTRLDVWDAQTGTLKQTFTGNVGPVLAVAFSPDGKTLAAGGAEKVVKLRDSQSGELKRTLTGNTGSVVSLAFSPDGTMLANGSSDRTIKIWDAQTGGLKHTLKGNEYTVWPIAFSPDSKTLASGLADGTIRVWDPQAGELRQTLTGHTGGVFSVAFSRDGKTLASGGTDGTVKLWDAQSGVLRQTLIGNTGFIMSVAFSPDGRTLVTGSAGNTVKLWDAKTGELRQTLTGHSGSVISIAFSPDGKTVASASLDKTIKLWQVQ